MDERPESSGPPHGWEDEANSHPANPAHRAAAPSAEDADEAGAAFAVTDWRRRVRDPGGPGAGLLAWAVLIVLLIATIALQWSGGPAPAPVAAQEPAGPGGLITLSGRYSVGAHRLATASVGSDDAQVADMADQLIEQSAAFAATDADQIRLAILAGELKGADAAAERLRELLDRPVAEGESRPEDERADANAAAPPDSEEAESKPIPRWVAEDARLLLGVYEAPGESDDAAAASAHLTDDQRRRLVERHGWFGRLAATYGAAGDPVRQRALAKASTFVVFVIIAISAGALAALAGFALLIIAIIFAARGRFPLRYHPPAPGGSVFLETFTLFIVGFLIVSIAGVAIERFTGIDATPLLIWLLLPIALWPVARGTPMVNWKYATGWRRGRGVAREIGAGLVGYIAGLPIFLAGIGLTLLLAFVVSRLTGDEGEPPSHPIVNEAMAGGVWTVVSLYLLAAVWAPLVEETMFRGALYHHFRGRLGPILSGVAVAFVFAIIHPQGIIAVPALMSLAIVFALIREWRGSLIGPIVAHSVHNGALVTILVVGLS